MIDTFKKIFNKQIDNKVSDIDCSFEHVKQYKFLLKYQNNEIGKLDYDGTYWSFVYSNEFKNQNDLTPLFEFPILDKKYTNKNLWPFFESRIPSEKQPKVQKYIDEHPSDKGDLAKLLSVFGSSSINNPYTLINL